jgi:hypothetical protein
MMREKAVLGMKTNEEQALAAARNAKFQLFTLMQSLRASGFEGTADRVSSAWREVDEAVRYLEASRDA